MSNLLLISSEITDLSLIAFKITNLLSWRVIFTKEPLGGLVLIYSLKIHESMFVLGCGCGKRKGGRRAQLGG